MLSIQIDYQLTRHLYLFLIGFLLNSAKQINVISTHAEHRGDICCSGEVT